jgi:tRNA U34 5-carboxymethylaminomethyl modifying GTPase MnmE/TrmE
LVLNQSDLPSLSKQINEINPDEYIAQMDNQLINLINRKKRNSKWYWWKCCNIKFSWKTSPNIIQLIQKTGKTIEKLEDELNKIEEKNKIESNKLLIYDKQANVESVINTNLAKIENSKELLKKYINAFVYSIKIIEHSVKYTVLQIAIEIIHT